MSERKVLTKYYPPDFDPSAVGRARKPKDAPVKLPTVRLMAPFSMKCATCGEYIYKGRKFNARKQTTDERYYNVKVIRFYIRCTRCSAEMTFKTDPKHNDYEAEKGMRRNFEPWREAKLAEETEEERLDRLEQEEAERDPMKELEQKVLDAKAEMAVADRLDEIRTRNARVERAEKERNEDDLASAPVRDLERERQDAEDAEAARLAFQSATGDKVRRLLEDEEASGGNEIVRSQSDMSSAAAAAAAAAAPSSDAPAAPAPAELTAAESMPPPPSFVKAKKRKQDFSAVLGIKKKKPTAA